MSDSMAANSESFATQGYNSTKNKDEENSNSKNNALKKWASKVTDRLLQKTKSINLFRNQQG